MPTIHELLDDTQKQCTALVKEMEAFKSARILNQKTVESLDATCKALKATAEAIKPFTESRVRRLLVFVVSTAVLNTLLFIGILLLLILRK